MFIWTEALGCPEILTPSLRSFFAHHDQTINVILYPEDQFCNEFGDRVVVHRLPHEGNAELPSASLVRTAYEKGHSGTAVLWSSLIARKSNFESMVHLDADNIYLRNVLDGIEKGLNQGFDVVGFRRAYFRTAAPVSLGRRITYRFRRDKVHTLAFGFYPQRLASIDDTTRLRLLRGGGRSRILGFVSPNLDFFDGAFDYLLSRSGKALFLGESNTLGQMNPRSFHEPVEQMRSTFLLFDAVGSGCVAFKRLLSGRLTLGDASPYERHAIQQFAAYSKLLLGNDIGVDFELSEPLAKQIVALDRLSWKLTE